MECFALSMYQTIISLTHRMDVNLQTILQKRKKVKQNGIFCWCVKLGRFALGKS